MRGRKLEPTHLKVIEGNPGKRRLNRAEPSPPGERIYLGLDLSSTTDLSALVAVSAETGERLAELSQTYTIVAVAHDRWRIENLLRDLRGAGLEAYVDGKEAAYAGALRLVPRGQGFRDMGPAVDALEVSILERRLQHPGNPALTDPAGNRKLDKSKTRLRIDGAVAAVMALGPKARDGAGEPEPSVHEHRGVLTI